MKIDIKGVQVPVFINSMSPYQVGECRAVVARCKDCGRKEYAETVNDLHLNGWRSINNRYFSRLLLCPACLERLKHQCNLAVIDALNEITIQHGVNESQAIKRLNQAIANNEITFLDGSVIFENKQ